MAEQRFSVPSDPTKTAASRRTSPRRGASNQTGSHAPLSARTSERPGSATADSPHYSWRRANEEDSGFESAIRAERAQRAEQSNRIACAAVCTNERAARLRYSRQSALQLAASE